MTHLVLNERIKYFATALNGVAVTCVGAGVVAPLVAVTYGVASGPSGIARAAVGSVVWLLVGAVLHWGVQMVLKKLQP